MVQIRPVQLVPQDLEAFVHRAHGRQFEVQAGGGIVADSDPEAELAEAQAKFVPVRDSLSG